MKFIVGVFIICITAYSAVGQGKKIDKEPLPVSVAYFGNLGVNPGIKIGAKRNLSELQRTKVKKRKGKSKEISKLFFLEASTALYSHPTTYTGSLTSVEVGRIRIKNGKWFMGPKLGLGMLAKINKGETWEVASDGTITEIGTGVNTYFSPTLSFVVGRKTLLKREITPYIQFTSYSTHVNDTWVFDLALEAGVQFSIATLGIFKHHSVRKK